MKIFLLIYTGSHSKIGLWQSLYPEFRPDLVDPEAKACGYTGSMQGGPKAGMQTKPKPIFESRAV